jgi:release factor glutamine methyltransferase
MLLRDALREGLATLVDHAIPSPQLAAELLLMHALGCDRASLHMRAGEPLPSPLAERYRLLISQRLTGKPTQYITGHQEFWGLDIEVTPDVLIPRPETEHVVEAVLDLVRNRGASPAQPFRIVDVGTGSGCIALALAHELAQAEIYAVDISPAALRVAERNAERLGLADRVEFAENDLLGGALRDSWRNSLDFVVSNPPYVGRDEANFVQREVREFEPPLAWGGLESGDEIYQRLLPQALEVLRPRGSVVVEIGFLKSTSVTRLLTDNWTEIEVCPDLAGIPRIVTAKKAAVG